MDKGSGEWFDRETAGCSLADARLHKRLRTLLERLGKAMGESIPLACENWVNTKEAYRFFANERISEAEIVEGHLRSTPDRSAAADGPILILHDTTEFTYQRERGDQTGVMPQLNCGCGSSRRGFGDADGATDRSCVPECPARTRSRDCAAFRALLLTWC